MNFNEDDYVIEAFRKDPFEINAQPICAKILHKPTGLKHESTTYRSFLANKAECIYQILGAVRRHNEKYETVSFKYFSVILEREKP